MSGLFSGQRRCSSERSASLRELILSVAVILTPAALVAQDSQDFVLPGLESEALLMAELVEAKVTFVDPAGIGEINDMLIGRSHQDFLFSREITVPAQDAQGGAKVAAVKPGMKTAASLNVRSAPGQPITIYVDKVNAGEGYALGDFRCNYNASDDVACDGEGFSGVSVESGTLIVGATLKAKGNAAAAPGNGSFDITISYQ
ncbi:MAG: hypothetical protein R3192_13260 [Woeseiaceae bacterium]|nr:hypothetical protein [Woeseiaceae bacterium]